MACECPGRRPPSVGARPVSKLSLLVGFAEPFSPSATGDGSSRSPSPRSPRSFDDGAVGLGIVAAMNDGGRDPHPWGAPITRTPRSTAPARSDPIPIVSARPAAAGVRTREESTDEADEQMELSESYTCVISHVGGAAVRKREYFDDGDDDCWGGFSAVLFETAAWPALLPPAEDFLSRCLRCRKKLHGLDIFMYRGDKAFCSAECRCQQVISDGLREKRVADALKPFECSSVSPCSAPLCFAAGVAAA